MDKKVSFCLDNICIRKVVIDPHYNTTNDPVDLTRVTCDKTLFFEVDFTHCDISQMNFNDALFFLCTILKSQVPLFKDRSDFNQFSVHETPTVI